MVLAPAVLSDYLLLVVLGFFAIIAGGFTIWFARSEPAPKTEINRAIYK